MRHKSISGLAVAVAALLAVAAALPTAPPPPDVEDAWARTGTIPQEGSGQGVFVVFLNPQTRQIDSIRIVESKEADVPDIVSTVLDTVAAATECAFLALPRADYDSDAQGTYEESHFAVGDISGCENHRLVVTSAIVDEGLDWVDDSNPLLDVYLATPVQVEEAGEPPLTISQYVPIVHEDGLHGLGSEITYSFDLELYAQKDNGEETLEDTECYAGTVKQGLETQIVISVTTC